MESPGRVMGCMKFVTLSSVPFSSQIPMDLSETEKMVNFFIFTVLI